MSFDGYAPSGTVTLDNTDCVISSLEYTAKPSDHLKNGDKVTVTVTVPEDCAKQYGKVPKAVSKEYTVSGLDGFVTSAAEIPDDIMNAMKKQAEDTFKAEFAKSAGEDEKLDSMTYVGNYFLTEKRGGRSRASGLLTMAMPSIWCTKPVMLTTENLSADIGFVALAM